MVQSPTSKQRRKISRTSPQYGGGVMMTISAGGSPLANENEEQDDEKKQQNYSTSNPKFLYILFIISIIGGLLNIVLIHQTLPSSSYSNKNNNEDDPQQQEKMKEKLSKLSTTTTSPPYGFYFPTTRFTPIVHKILKTFNPKTIKDCKLWVTIRLEQDSNGANNGNGNIIQQILPILDYGYQAGYWVEIVNRTFNPNLHSNRTLPLVTNSSTSTSSSLILGLGFSNQDRDLPTHPLANLGCLSSSSPKGMNAFMNFLEAKRQAAQIEYTSQQVDWQNRITVPVFRGTAHGNMKIKNEYGSNLLNIYKEKKLGSILPYILKNCLRCRAVYYSSLNPNLLNAKFHAPLGELFDPPYRKIIKENATNGLHHLLPFSKIPQTEFYTNYQVAVVLCGIGAAFRTAIHLSTETTVVLQECPYDEWFTHLLKPWKHYIPIDNELSKLNETMVWIQQNPQKVRDISLDGKQFYQDYLSIERTEEFVYELFYRIAIQIQNSTNNNK